MKRSTIVLLALLLAPVQVFGDERGASAEDLFAQRIMPIFKSPNPSSCIQCHLSSVDLKDYIRPSCEETFVALRSQGLINVDSPETSKILTLIEMGEKDQDKSAKMIHAKTRAAELEAFTSWVVACCRDERYRALQIEDGQDIPSGPKVEDEVIRHNRKDRVLDSFVRNVWSQRMRCFPCHTPNELDRNDPKHETPAQRHQEYVAQYGQRMNIFRETPEASMKAIIASSRKTHKDELPLINIEHPEQSLLVLKPTAKLPAKQSDGELAKPSSIVPVTHGGGLKMHVDDFSYKAFMSWMGDFALVAGGQYQSASELPADNWYPSNQVIRVANTPAAWTPLSTVQFFVHPWNAATGEFSDSPLAFTQTKIGPRGMAIGTLFLIASKADRGVWSADGAKLDPGKYEIRAYVDLDKRIEQDATLLLNDRQPDGSVAIDAQWREGFPQAEVIEGKQFKSSSSN